MKTTLFSILCLVLFANLSKAQVIPGASLFPTTGLNYCTNPISMDFGASFYNFSIGTPVTFYIDFGDGTNYTAPTQYVANVYDSLFGTIVHTYVNAGTYSPVLTVTAPGVAPYVATWYWGQNTLTVAAPGSCGQITGTVYNDANNNCIPDPGEGVNTQQVMVSLNGVMVAQCGVDPSGNYSLNYQYNPGQTYIVSEIPYGNNNGCYAVVCPAALTYAVNTPNASNIDFGIEINNTNYDLIASWIGTNGGILNAGFNKTFYAYFNNWLCPFMGGTYTVTLDPSLVYVSATPVPTTVVGNTLTWNLAQIPSWDYVEVVAFVPLNNINNIPFVIGDSIYNTSTVTGAFAGDINPLNNTKGRWCHIGTAYDPNDKHSIPKGQGPNGNVGFGTEFTYDIHFQNTGVSPALNVTITDTLDADIDESTVVILNNTHHMLTTITGNVLKFEFPNIMLPDSASNFAGSQGGLSFKAKHKNGLANNTAITNKAYIYFDNNPAVITNTALNTLANPVAVKDLTDELNISIAPNPVTGILNIHSTGKNIGQIDIQNILGETVAHHTVNDLHFSINMSSYKSGVYFVKLTDEKGNIYTRKIAKQ